MRLPAMVAFALVSCSGVAPTDPSPPAASEVEAEPASDLVGEQTGGDNLGMTATQHRSPEDPEDLEGELQLDRGALGVPQGTECSPGQELGGKKMPPVPTIAFKVERSDESESRIIQRVVRQRQTQLRACYANTLAVDESANGWVDVELSLAASGGVEAVSVDGFDAKLAACVKQAVDDLQFPAVIAGPVIVKLRFRPG